MADSTADSQWSSINLPELNLRITREGWTEVTFVRDSQTPSLKEQALEAMEALELFSLFLPEDKRREADTIRRALESLPE